jgi:dihydrofolate synthase / folylpolyglutamate synthase
MLASILGAAGFQCGLYTKPHLQSYRERIRVDGVAITPDAFTNLIGRFRDFSAQLPADAGEPTTFEVTTAIALDYFAQQHCQFGVIEVGLGGRLDATNATDPELSVIASISYDHTAILGRTLGAIAREKAGILRGGRTALLAQQRSAAATALRRACREVGAHCASVPPLEHDVPLAGPHQRQNAALAIAAARALVPDINESAISGGLHRLRWPGRFEVVGNLVLDGAHNGASAEVLAETLRRYADGRRITLVIGINRDKDARAVLRPLVKVAHGAYATQAKHSPRALPAAELGRLCRRMGAVTTVEPSLERALEAANNGRDHLVCVTGSLLLVGQARTLLELPVPERLW